jgi:hypothetical protein
MNRSEHPRRIDAAVMSNNRWSGPSSLDIMINHSLSTTVVLINQYRNESLQIRAPYPAEPSNRQRAKYSGINQVVDPSPPDLQNSGNVFGRQ